MKLAILLALLFPSLSYAQTAKELKAHTYLLANDGRVEGSERMRMCQDYIQWLCKSWQYEVELQPVGKCNNLLAWREGLEPGVVVIGAHLDTAGNKPGADDNASGSAMLLGLAKKYARAKPKYTMLFIWFTAEERGLIGSKYYVNNPKWPLKDHRFLLNFDMVGRLSKKYTDDGESLNEILRKLSPKYPFAREVTYTTGRQSDHASFARKGIPVVWLFTGTHRDYHTARDTPDKINYDGMELLAGYASAIIDEMVPMAIDYTFDLPEIPEDH
jgi:Zn-dependent M28 family amino/carboxypeptidase